MTADQTTVVLIVSVPCVAIVDIVAIVTTSEKLTATGLKTAGFSDLPGDTDYRKRRETPCL